MSWVFDDSWEEVCTVDLNSSLPKYLLNPFPLYQAGLTYQPGDFVRVIGKCGDIEYVYVGLEVTNQPPSNQSPYWEYLYCAGNGKKNTCKKEFECKEGIGRVVDLGGIGGKAPLPCKDSQYTPTFCGGGDREAEGSGLICVPVERYDGGGKRYGDCPNHIVGVFDGFEAEIELSFDPGNVSLGPYREEGVDESLAISFDPGPVSLL